MPTEQGRRRLELRRGDDHWVGEFTAMASPCQALIETDDRRDAEEILTIVFAEAWRIEDKFSRYQAGNVVHAINNSRGRAVEFDDETARLLDFAGLLHEMSDGRFDITSGVLRRAWAFDGSDRVPQSDAVERALRLVGWSKVKREGNSIRLEPGMEVDLGGIGKEYAVDRAADLVADETPVSCLINFGGDLRVTCPRTNEQPWRVGVEKPGLEEAVTQGLIALQGGGLATSGDSRRFLIKDGVRYSHILDPTTGWPVPAAPRSITVAAPTCVQAGMIATLAMLEGAGARAFLEAEETRFWICD